VGGSFPVARLAALTLFLLAGSLCGCAPAEPGAPYSLSPRLPYAACGDMGDLRANLTGNRDISPQSDAVMRYLGVRCLGPGPIPPPPALRARY
jgi:hypothetical protein